MEKKQKKENFAVSIIWIVLLALVFRSFIFSSYNIPTGSKHSLPFSVPLIPKRIFSSNPKRGDVVIFKLPTDNKTDYVKRVIGLPGDTVQIIDGKVFLNGKILEYKYKTS